MMKLISYSLILIWILSCNSGGQASPIETTEIKSNKPETRENGKIRFDFTAAQTDSFRKIIQIKASLINDNDDTVYFLTSTCDGEQYSLRYDTTRFILTPFRVCNASFPQIVKIAPNGHYDFQADFRVRTNETKIKLGFDFYQVGKSTNLEKVSLSDIHNSHSKYQNILWTEEKTIR